MKVSSLALILFTLTALLARGQSPSDLAINDDSSEYFDLALVGLWSGVNRDGIIVSYLFEEDGKLSIYENEELVLGNVGDLTCHWRLEMLGKRKGGIKVACENGRGQSMEVDYVVRFGEDGRLVLRSGVEEGRRPNDVAERDDRMQIRLTRQM